MIISSLELVNLRNIRGERFEPGSELNFFYGDNAQGKTNLLEALYILGRSKSFRTPRLNEVISYGEPEAIIRATVLVHDTGCEMHDISDHGSRIADHGSRIAHHASRQKELAVQIAPRSTSLFLNGKRHSLSGYLGNLAVFVCSLEHMDIIRGEPEHRRNFLDDGILSLDPKYVKLLDEYNRILKQKNRLLKAAAESEDAKRFIEQLEVWNEPLAEYGTLIRQARARYVEQLSECMSGRLFEWERIEIRYRSCLEAHGDSASLSASDYRKLLAERLRIRLEAELAVGYSLVGPHRDDLEIKFNGQDLRHYGSLGQQRSALIILDLGQISVYNRAFENRAVFLLDDLDAELDRSRIEILLAHLEGRAQSFITTSKRDIAEAYSRRASLFHIKGGRILFNGRAAQ